MALMETEPSYERVFTITDYYDGPRQGIAHFKGQPHFYDCLCEPKHGGYLDLFFLTPISMDIFELAIEDWAIWQKWELAFHTGKASQETHGALPADRERHQTLAAILDLVLKTEDTGYIMRRGSFEAISEQATPVGVMRNLQVKWSEPDSSAD